MIISGFLLFFIKLLFWTDLHNNFGLSTYFCKDMTQDVSKNKSNTGYEIYQKFPFQFVLRRHITLWQFVGAPWSWSVLPLPKLQTLKDGEMRFYNMILKDYHTFWIFRIILYLILDTKFIKKFCFSLFWGVTLHSLWQFVGEVR